MGSSDGEAIPAPEAEGAGGSRAQHGGNAGCAILAPRFCCMNRNVDSTLGLHLRREQQVDAVCLIGQGSAALVYLVRCKLTGRMSALKVQRKAEHARSVERVQMEREVMVNGRHPLVAPLHAAFQDRLYLYLDMEYCPGGSLDNFVRYSVKRNLTEDEVRFYAAEITLGLEFLHSKGYVYRDLKAANVLVAASGHIKLTDFGIAEKGNVMFEPEDKAVSPPRPLPRTQSAPFVAKTAQAQVVVRRRRQSLSQGAVYERIVSPTHGDTGTPPRPESCNRTSSPSSCASSPARVENARETSGGFPKFFRRRQQNLSSETTSRSPGLASRMRDKLRLSHESPSAGSVSCSELPSLQGSAAAAPESQTTAPENSDCMGSMGAPIPSHERPNSSPREGGWRKAELPPPGPLGAATQDRPESAPSSQKSQPATRQTSVALAESSWGVISGSPEYMAPEVLMHDPLGSAVDWWGMGILAYELLVGRTPFADEGGKTRHTYLNIMNKEVQFLESGEREEGDLTQVCKNFVQALLNKDPRGRAGSRGAHMVKSHPFFSSVSWAHLLEQKAPLVPHRLGTSCCFHPPVVKNTSGWWWDVEDAVAAEEEARLTLGQEKQDVDLRTREDAWWPFDKFNWSDNPKGWGQRAGVAEGVEVQCGACAKEGEVPFTSDGAPL